MISFSSENILNFPHVFSATCPISEVNEDELHDQELEISKQFKSPARRTQYIAGRIAARRAIKNCDPNFSQPILRSTEGLPLWPSSFIGSISHNDEIAIASITASSNYLALGIDLEALNRDLEIAIEKRVFTDREREWANQEKGRLKERLLSTFSAKESIYKALYPVCKTVFGFKDLELEWNSDNQSFKARLLEHLSEQFSRDSVFNVKVKVFNNLILTGLVVPQN